MNAIERLAEIFSRFPGIGPRQARRFVYFLLSRNGDYSGELVRAVEELKKVALQCQSCFRFFVPEGRKTPLCNTCADEARDPSTLMLVSRDVDCEAVEKSGGYRGYYFILGGVIPILEKEPEKRIRAKELDLRLKKDKKIKEVILATNANLDGENTADFIKERYKNLNLEFSVLGRGLSTGAELEYADPETLKNALLHRTK
ncbi:MAG: toprim domain-containing protein [Minisyncoccia bacterium]